MVECIVVIGSNSISGAYFVKYCLERGHDVIGISRSAEPDISYLPYRWGTTKHDNFTFHQLDLNQDVDRYIEIIKRNKSAYVVNFASQSMVGESWLWPEHWYTTNVVSTIKLHNQLRQCDFLDRYVHVSTPEVYGDCADFISENINYYPSTPYAVSRAAADMSLHSFYETYQFPVVFTRAANVYGPGQKLYRIIPRTILYLMNGKKLQLHGGGKSQRSFVHATDVADATYKVMKTGKQGDIYHIATENIISIKDLVVRICDHMGRAFEDCVEIADDRLGKDTAYLLDTQKIRNELDWSDKVAIDQGIEQVIVWAKKYFDKINYDPFDYQHKP